MCGSCQSVGHVANEYVPVCMCLWCVYVVLSECVLLSNCCTIITRIGFVCTDMCESLHSPSGNTHPPYRIVLDCSMPVLACGSWR